MTVEVTHSKEIPVLAYGCEDSNTNGAENTHEPPEFVMIEINGELIAPVEFPSKDSSRTILGGSDGKQVELGKLQLDDKQVGNAWKVL